MASQLDSGGRRLAADNIDLAKAIARSFARRWRVADPSDIESDAHLGLCYAAARFDGRSGSSFRTYARHVIRGAVLDGVRTRRGRFGERWEATPGDITVGALLPPVADHADATVIKVAAAQQAGGGRTGRVVAMLTAGYSQADCADFLDVTDGAISTRLRLIRERCGGRTG